VVRIDADVGRNRLIITLSGSPTGDRTEDVMRELDAALTRLRAPIDVLSDVRALEAFKLAGEKLRAFGVRRSVRIVGKSANAAVAMERFARHLQHHAAHLAFSEAEADAAFTK
jgi:2'-5' RNA ligase